MVNVTYNIIQCTYGPNHFTQVNLTIQYVNNSIDKYIPMIFLSYINYN